MTNSRRTTPKQKPSQVLDDYWVYAERKTATYPEATERSGKWLIFVPLLNLDAVWERVRLATEAGKLGDSAKTAGAV